MSKWNTLPNAIPMNVVHLSGSPEYIQSCASIPLFAFDYERDRWLQMRNMVHESLHYLFISRGSAVVSTVMEAKLHNLIDKLENLVIQSAFTASNSHGVLQPGDSHTLALEILSQRLVRKWNMFCSDTQDVQIVHSLVESVEQLHASLKALEFKNSGAPLVQPTQYMEWSVCIHWIADMLPSQNFRILDSLSPAGNLGGFLRIQTHKILRPEFEDTWSLWSPHIMDDVRQVGDLKLPIDQILEHFKNPVDIVLIGVGGCGKSRTCYDLCRFSGKFRVFLDWVHHDDLYTFLKFLPMPPVDYDRSNRLQVPKFYRSVSLATKRMLISRLIVLKLKLEHANGHSFSPDDYFQMQQLSRVKNLCVFGKIYAALENVRDEEIDPQFETIKAWASQLDVRYVLDESHRLLGVHRDLFHSSSCDALDSDGKYVEPRSYFSFLAHFFMEHKLNTVWAGTHLRMGDISRITSASCTFRQGRKPVVFTDFNSLTPRMICALLEKWVVVSDQALRNRISNILQGRPRIFMEFIVELSRSRDVVSDSNLLIIFERVVSGLEECFVDFWKTAWKSPIHRFAPDMDLFNPVHTVASLLEDLLYNDYITDKTKNIHAEWYPAMVGTGLVMLSEGISGGRGLICEPLVLSAAVKFGMKHLHRHLPVDTILNRDLCMESDESGRGRAIESLCVVQLRESFWTRDGFRDYFPADVNRMLDQGGISPPLGIHDCRKGKRDHREKLRLSFLNPDATHVVLTLATQGAADVVYGFFTFHIKTKWVDVNQRQLVITDSVANANVASIDNTWRGNTELADRVATMPWVRVWFEFPTNPELVRLGIPEKIERDGIRTTITASIDSQFTKLFFGEQVVTRIKQLTGLY